MIHFCTLFDSRYAARALVMLESLERHCHIEKSVTVLAMDDAVPKMLRGLGRTDWRVITVADMQDADLQHLGTVRPRREFCWTCVPALVHHMVGGVQDGDTVVYVDADLRFFAPPEILLDELGADGTILIHEHRYSEDRKSYEATSGRFNVGFVAFRVGEEARACTTRWRQQVIEKCELDPENGFCGDQGYLNEWPGRYPGLRVMRNIGGGVAPWNLAQHRVDGTTATPSVDGVPIVFFHYHAFRTVAVGPLGHVAAIPAWGYDIPGAVAKLLFSDYARQVRRISKRMADHGVADAADMRQTVPDALRAWRRGALIPAF